MNKRLFWLAICLLAVLALVGVAYGSATPTTALAKGPEAAPPAQDSTEPKYTFYWISHGSEGDPIWIYAINGATKAGKDLNVEVKSSFHRGDIAAQKEAIAAAVAAGADGIATSSPQEGVLTDEIAMAKEAGIPVVFFNTDDPATGRNAYVGANVFNAGQMWAQYLVDNDLVQKGDFVWMPVEVPGATYQTEETRGIASVFDPLGIKYEVFDAKYDPIETLANQTDYLTANADEVDAIIGLGDLVMGNMQAAFEAADIEPGQIPVVGWGNSPQTAQAVKEGYVNAALWQYPDSQGYMPIVLLHMLKEGMATGYDVTTMALYDKDTADTYIKLTETMK